MFWTKFYNNLKNPSYLLVSFISDLSVHLKLRNLISQKSLRCNDKNPAQLNRQKGNWLKETRGKKTRGKASRETESGTWEQMESNINDMRAFSLTLHCMSASFFCDRLTSSLARNVAATHWSLTSYWLCDREGAGPLHRSGSSNDSRSHSSKQIARHGTECFACIHLFNDFMDPLQWILLSCAFYGDKLRHGEVKKLGESHGAWSGRAEVWTQAVWHLSELTVGHCIIFVEINHNEEMGGFLVCFVFGWRVKSCKTGIWF